MKKKYSQIHLNKIEEYKNFDISVLKQKNLSELAKIYYGENANLKDCLISDAKVLFASYNDELI